MKWLCYLYFTVILLYSGNLIQAQSDTLFDEAKFCVDANNLPCAKSILLKLHDDYPENNDYTMYLARIYYWTGSLDSSIALLNPLLEKGIKSAELLDLAISVTNGLQQSERAIALCEQGINQYPASADFYHFQKAVAYKNLNEPEQALAELDRITKTPQNKKEIDYLRMQIFQLAQNMVSMGYLDIRCTDPSPGLFYFAHLEYLRKEKKMTYVVRCNYGYLGQTAALQGEGDLYYKMNRKRYLYSNLGFSSGKSIFPAIRLGAEYYFVHNLIGISAGARFLKFESINVLMFTGHIAFENDNWYTTYRPFIVHQTNSLFFSHTLNFRRTFESKESFIQLDLQYGSLPYYYFTADGFERTNAYRVGINTRWRLAKHFFIQPIVMYEWEEYEPGSFRNRINTQLIFSLRF